MSYMYITTGPRACDIVNNSSSKIEIPLPDHKLTASTLSGSKKPKRKESSISRKNEKKKKGRRKSSLKTKRGQQKSPKKVPNHSSSPVENSSNTYHSQSKIICLDSSSEIDGLIDGSEDENNGWYQRLPPRRAKSKQRKIIEQSGSDSLDDFDLHSDENLS
uniref:Uncharacterized protein n=2 Tax=Corethron hystrix TaxID=216773 RepID=A0A7S1BAY7_9STRA|mmetsp:Transcript_19205/g.43749  ORF Transcript_19205/g.43749 Transcript_19205/m.43749 type:complete len:161 (+) Transcript_19205:1176-1658(+)